MTGGIHSGGNSEQNITYDANGTIGSLNRTGAEAAGLGYTYSGNRLTSLTKDGTSYSYAYDANGNTTTDGLRAMTLTYNQLNLSKREWTRRMVGRIFRTDTDKCCNKKG